MDLSDFTGERFIPGVEGKIAIEHLHRYSFAINFVQGKNVLDIACGEGYGSSILSRFALNVSGVDIDHDVVSHANNKYSNNNLNFFVGSVLQIPFPENHFDVIVSFETIEHISEHNEMFHELKRVLKPKGVLIISSPEKRKYSDEKNGTNSKFHIKELYLNEFRELVKLSFSSSKIFYQDFLQGTVILPFNSKSTDLTFFEGDFNNIRNVLEISPEFVIIVASNNAEVIDELRVNTTIFSNNLFFEKEFNFEDKVLKGFRYKFINFIFSPYDWLKNKSQK
jgi:ubiquinone/menaquinone biosynthesis C-methylase UbiE